MDARGKEQLQCMAATDQTILGDFLSNFVYDCVYIDTFVLVRPKLVMLLMIFLQCTATKKQKSQNIFRQFLCCFRPSNATVQQQSLPLPTTASDENGSATKAGVICDLCLIQIKIRIKSTID